MVRPQVVDGGDALQLWRAAANISNKQLWTAEKEWSSSLEVRRRANKLRTIKNMPVTKGNKKPWT
jgi:hypothetical protein